MERWKLIYGKWNARIKYLTKSEHLGTFVNEVDAAYAYDRRANELTALDGRSRPTKFTWQMPAPDPRIAEVFFETLYVLGPSEEAVFAACARLGWPVAPTPHSVEFCTWDQFAPAQQQASTNDRGPTVYSMAWAPLARERTWMVGYDSANALLGLSGHLGLCSGPPSRRRLIARMTLPTHKGFNYLLAGPPRHLHSAYLYDTTQPWHDCLRVTLQ